MGDNVFCIFLIEVYKAHNISNFELGLRGFDIQDGLNLLILRVHSFSGDSES